MFGLTRRHFLKNSVLTGLGLGLLSRTSAAGADTDFVFQTPYYKIGLNPGEPAFGTFSVDSLGHQETTLNPLFPYRITSLLRYRATATPTRVAYRLQNGDQTPVWEFSFGEKSLTITSRYVAGGNEPLELVFDQKQNHATLLGLLVAASQQVQLPAVLHLPGMGSVRITGPPAGGVAYDARRFVTQPYVRLQFLAATQTRPTVSYQLDIATIYPALTPAQQTDPRYDGVKRNFINIFQLNPRLRMLANNSSSDACAFTLYKYAELARHTPPLADGLTAMNLIQTTLDEYLRGKKAYGLTGFNKEDPDLAHADILGGELPYNHLDSLPSLVIAACQYILTTHDAAWADQHYAGIGGWLTELWQRDTTGNGLVKFQESGNSGSWTGNTQRQRPANWWDTIGFGHEDAYANALTYRATRLFADVATQLNRPLDARTYRAWADKLKAAYYPAFYNPKTGVLAGWRSADGQLHDYYFTFVNSMAVLYGLVSDEHGNRLMDTILAKIKAVGFTNFGLGLPGNLVSVNKADYPEKQARWGYSEDGVTGFQVYENGGATACFAYFTIAALQKLGRTAEANAILLPILDSMNKRGFEGLGPNGMSNDWKNWQGEPNGYEGFLVDSYLIFLAVLPPD